jgi:predicted permease
MRNTPMWRRYLRMTGSDVRADLEEELRFHIEMRTEELIARGMDPERARTEAERRLGDLRGIREECMEIGGRTEREHRRREGWAIAIQEAGQAARGLTRSPGFAIVAVLTLALGIGANTAIFSLLDSVLFRPLPVSGLDRLVVIREDLPSLGLLDAQLAPPEVLDIAARTDAFEAVTGITMSDETLTDMGEPRRVSTAYTLGNFFGLFGVTPHAGTFYRPEHSTDGPHDVAVVSHGFWQQVSGGDPSFVGETVQLGGISYQVIGVMPPDFRYPREVQIWMPFEFSDRWLENRGSLFMTTIGRVQPGVGDAQLAAMLDSEAARWNEEYHSGSEFGKVLSSTGFIEYTAGPLRLILLVLMGAVVFVLMIAAANVASLQLVRAAGRSKEIAVRAAVGAGRTRIVRQLMMESGIIALLGAVLGLAIAVLMLKLLAAWGPAQEMYLGEVALDQRVLFFTLVVSLLAAAVFGTIPAMRAARIEPQEVLRESGRGASAGLGRSRLLRASIVVQVALALVLLLGSVLMVRTLSELLGSDPGFDPENLVTAEISVPGTEYDSPARSAFFEQVLRQVRALPGLEDAAISWGLPFTGQGSSSPIALPGRPEQPGDPERHAQGRTVSDGYFETMRIQILRGRGFDGTERRAPPAPPL